jgi:hypothetical protein
MLTCIEKLLDRRDAACYAYKYVFHENSASPFSWIKVLGNILEIAQRILKHFDLVSNV